MLCDVVVLRDQKKKAAPPLRVARNETARQK
jgi:hypothetical protein